jgi:hypothetical protein
VWRRHGVGERIAAADGLRGRGEMAAARERMDTEDRGRERWWGSSWAGKRWSEGVWWESDEIFPLAVRGDEVERGVVTGFSFFGRLGFR